MTRQYEHYTPLNLSEHGRKLALIGHLSACAQEGFISEKEGCILIDAAMRVMAEDWTNALSLKRWAKARAGLGRTVKSTTATSPE